MHLRRRTYGPKVMNGTCAMCWRYSQKWPRLSLGKFRLNSHPRNELISHRFARSSPKHTKPTLKVVISGTGAAEKDSQELSSISSKRLPKIRPMQRLTQGWPIACRYSVGGVLCHHMRV